ncbi:MAG: M24 family metallopeptidase [Desulfovibrio sp.]
MFERAEALPVGEIDSRIENVQSVLQEKKPEVSGLLISARLNLYYLTGTLGQGVLWVPIQGKPVLMVRKGLERAKLESPLENICRFKSYAEIAGLAKDFGSPIGDVVAIEKGGMSWQMGEMLTARMKGVSFVGGDGILAQVRSVKSPYELEMLRIAGTAHAESVEVELPKAISAGMSEYVVSTTLWDIYFSRGHQGVLRMGAYGEESFLGHVCAGDSGNYPSAYNGPLGIRGVSPAAPCMGSRQRVWNEGMILSVDTGFGHAGYHTDKTQVFWAGKRVSEHVYKAHSVAVEIIEYLAGSLKPGAVPEELYTRSLEMAAAAGYEEGYMGLGENKVPFVGHSIGLVIDETPVLAKRFTEPLQEGMVIALEPKIGLAGVGMVGPENTFEVTAAGGRSLTGEHFQIICVEQDSAR